ncbi:MAG: hypothetical protein CVU46_15555 [Chloroflexi bacterium HGW-Chloroflexi-8]|nr:MAG: hypothetical protein CVU46_15555 [Chloroflexi bacterium HGW-Chloroflexi-8]
MATRYPIKIDGFENQKVELESSGFFSPAKITINGVKAEPGIKRNEMLLRKPDGSTVSVFFQNAFFDTIPRLIVNGKTIQIAPPLKWYQYTFCGLTLFLILFGGAIGSIFSMIGFLINIRTMRVKWKPLWRYLAILATHMIVLAAYLAVSVLITVLTTGGS